MTQAQFMLRRITLIILTLALQEYFISAVAASTTTTASFIWTTNPYADFAYEAHPDSTSTLAPRMTTGIETTTEPATTTPTITTTAPPTTTPTTTATSLATTATTVVPTTTTEPPPDPDPPSDFHITQKKFEQVDVSWSPPDDREVNYNVTVYFPEDDSSECTVSSSSSATCRIRQPYYGVIVNITLTAFKEDSESIQCTNCTLRTITVPAEPESVSVKAINNTSVSVEWEAPSVGKVSGYLLTTDKGDEPLSTTSTSAVVDNLQSNERVYINVTTVAKHDGLEDTPSNPRSTTAWTKPDAVSELVVTPAEHSLLLKWKLPKDGGTTYVILVFDSNGVCHLKTCLYGNIQCNDSYASEGCKNNVSEVIDARTTEYNTSAHIKLQPCSNYTVVVFVENEGGRSRNTTGDSKTLVADPASKIKGVSLSAGTDHVNATWDHLSDPCPAFEYIIEYNYKDFATGDNKTKNKIVGPSVTFAKISEDIQPYWIYVFTVAARTKQNGDIGGSKSEPKTTQTQQTEPGPVANVSVKSTGDTWIYMEWDEPRRPNGEIKEYDLNYTRLGFVDADTDDPEPGQVQSSTTQRNITGLSAFSRFEVIIRAKTEVGAGNWSDSTKANTSVGAPLPVSNINTTVGKRNITVRWMTPVSRTGPTNYTVTAKDERTGENQTTHVTGFYKNTAVVSGVQPFTRYYILVTTVMETGSVTEISPEAVLTEPDVPGPINETTIEAVPTDTTISLKWSPPTEPNGNLTHYEVVYRRLGFLDQPEDGGSNMTDKTDGDATAKNLTNLRPYSTYQIHIYGVTSAGRANKAPDFTASTEPGDPHPVQNVKAIVDKTDGKGVMLNVSWTPPVNRTGNTSYLIEAEDLTFGDVVKSKTESGITSSTTTFTLHFFRKYTFNVTTRVFAGVNKYLESKAVQSDGQIITPEGAPSEPPRRKITKDRNCTSAKFEWQPVEKKSRNGITRNYTIRWTKQNAPDKVFIKLRNASEEIEENDGFYETYIDLDPETRYNITVLATNNVGSSPPSGDNIVLSTACAPPYPVGEKKDEYTKIVKPASNDNLKEKEATVMLSRGFFTDNSHGKITYRAIVVADTEWINKQNESKLYGGTLASEKEFREKYRNIWIDYDANEKYGHYRIQLKPSLFPDGKRSRHDTTSDEIPFVLGKNTQCEPQSRCNGDLRSGKDYRVKAATCTSGGCTETYYSPIVRTISPGPNGGHIAAGILVPLLIIGLVAGFVLCMYRQDLGPFKPKQATQAKPTPEYLNPALEMEAVPNPVALTDFPEHVRIRHLNSDLVFSDEYKFLKESSPRMTWNAAELAQNRAKNRFNNILPYDHSRVRLLPVDEDDESGSDYINANYMPGYTSKREFIATQGPLASTKDDFWRLVWEQHVPIIVMLTKCVEKGRLKCDQYWPNDNEPVYYGDLQVHVKSQSVLNNYTIRIIDISLGRRQRRVKHMHVLTWPDHGCPTSTDLVLEFTLAVRHHMTGNPKRGPIVVHCRYIQPDEQRKEHDYNQVFGDVIVITHKDVNRDGKGETQRTVRHFNFETWPDFGCPDTTDALLQFVLVIRSHSRGQHKGPILIHCSAGVGRTGTFVCVDRLLQQMRDHDTVDVFGTILEMRRYRTNMVQTEDQYIYIHDCLNDALAQGLPQRYPNNAQQLPPELSQPTEIKEEDMDHLYENAEISFPRNENINMANGNNTQL